MNALNPISDFALALRREGARLRGGVNGAPPIRGHCVITELQDGLSLHAVDAVTLRDFESRATRPAGLVLHCFLRGLADAELDGAPLGLGRSGQAPPRLVLTALQAPAAFVKRSRQGDAICKVSVRVSPEWLARRGIEATELLDGAQNVGPVLRKEWLAGPRALRAAEQLARGEGPHAADRLLQEALTLELLAEALRDAAPQAAMTRHDRKRLERMEAFIRAADGSPPSLARVAEEGGVSLSTQRRLFLSAHGCGAATYARRLRMEAAATALARGAAVSEAARIAGYGSSESFSAAWRRERGAPPSAHRPHRWCRT